MPAQLFIKINCWLLRIQMLTFSKMLQMENKLFIKVNQYFPRNVINDARVYIFTRFPYGPITFKTI